MFDIDKACKKVIKGERCLHGMVFEYCAVCQAIEYTMVVKIPIKIKDEESEKEKTIFIEREVNRKQYRCYR